MSQRLDFHGDVSHGQLTAIQQTYDIPGFVKQADIGELNQLPPRKAQYADPIHLSFPCHTKAAAMLSVYYFLENQDSLLPRTRERVGENLTKFAEFWGIRPELEKAVQQHKLARDNQQPESLPDSSFALVKVAEDGTVTREYKLRNSLEVKAAAEWFVSSLPNLRKEYTFADRHTIADRILDKAAEYGTGLGDVREPLERCAGRGQASAPDLAHQIDLRRVYLKQAGRNSNTVITEQLKKLAAIVRSRPAVIVDPGTLYDIASAIDQADREMGIIDKYADNLPSPEEVAFRVTDSKLAATQADAVETQSGAVYDRGQFQKLSLAKIRDAFGPEFVAEVSGGIRIDPRKMAEVVATLPRNDAERLDKLMLSVGERPAKVAAFPIGMPPEALMQLAGTNR